MNHLCILQFILRTMTKAAVWVDFDEGSDEDISHRSRWWDKTEKQKTNNKWKKQTNPEWIMSKPQCLEEQNTNWVLKVLSCNLSRFIWSSVSALQMALWWPISEAWMKTSMRSKHWKHGDSHTAWRQRHRALLDMMLVSTITSRILDFPVDMLHTLSTWCELWQIYSWYSADTQL